jgi:hypothetical protein
LSPIDTQVSVTTQSASATAFSGSCPISIAAPDCFAQAAIFRSSFNSGGVATLRRKSKLLAAWIQDASTLLASPVQATVWPLIAPLRSSNVITSAITWQGCDSRVSPLITGTVACAASSIRES